MVGSGRQRIMDAIGHREPDRIPVDFGSSMVTSIHVEGYENLKNYLNIGTDRKTEIARGRSLVAVVDPEVQDHLNVDARMLIVNGPDGWEAEDARDSVVDEWGIEWERPKGFSNYEIKKSPLQGKISVDDVRNMKWPDASAVKFMGGLRDRAKALRNSTDKAIVANLAMQIHTQSYFLRGFSEYLMDLVLNQKLIEAIMDRVLEIFLERTVNIMSEIGEFVDIVYVADDLGAQNGPLFSPQVYRKILKPRQKKLFEAIKRNSDVKILYHTCGAVVEFIDDLAEIGVDILNPVQTSAGGMDPKVLKSRFGKKICFWGGIDTQKVLPFGKPQDVRDEVERRIDEFASGGGYVVAAIHNIRPEVPPENIVAMIEAVHEFGKY
ncbi:MAG: uroporphyrinogen decarboxylase family protein [Syntrophales bacterium]